MASVDFRGTGSVVDSPCSEGVLDLLVDFRWPRRILPGLGRLRIIHALKGFSSP